MGGEEVVLKPDETAVVGDLRVRYDEVVYKDRPRPDGGMEPDAVYHLRLQGGGKAEDLLLRWREMGQPQRCELGFIVTLIGEEGGTIRLRVQVPG